ncbi:MAG TPA: ATP-grasp domain-containing protein [Vicinamibacterales bacterium]|nr:ATP-grasp domain-containing protein [Vicinamibacterales bacterium]
MARVLLLATTTGYQTRAFGDAAERLGVELVFATDRCNVLDDPWQDGAIAIRFHEEAASVEAIVAAARLRPIDGLLVVGDLPTVIAARAAQALGLPGHPPDAAAIAKHKLRTRERLSESGLPVPWFVPIDIDRPSLSSERPWQFPCVVKPVALSGSRGVMRADDQQSLDRALARLRTLLDAPDVRAERDRTHRTALVEGFIPGREFAVEGLLHHGALHVLAVFDKPDPLDGPFFEETIYLTPSQAPEGMSGAIVAAVGAAARAIGLHHGPVHAECRVNGRGVYVLEVAARPIGGLCARALRFEPATSDPEGGQRSLEELLLRHALGEPPAGWAREASASGVMMIPIPRRGVLRGVAGIEDARAVSCVDEVRITAKTDQLLVPLPEGASYLGFIFARAGEPGAVDRALRDAHARLQFAIDPEFPVLGSETMRYNHAHG